MLRTVNINIDRVRETLQTLLDQGREDDVMKICDRLLDVAMHFADLALKGDGHGRV